MCGKLLWSACILLSVWLSLVQQSGLEGRISTLAPPFICLAMQAGMMQGWASCWKLVWISPRGLWSVHRNSLGGGGKTEDPSILYEQSQLLNQAFSREVLFPSWSTCNQMVCQHQMILRTSSWENLPPFLLNQQPIKCFHFSQVDIRRGTDEGMVSTKSTCPQNCCGHLFWSGWSCFPPLGYKQEVLLWWGGWITWDQKWETHTSASPHFHVGVGST